MDVQRMQQEFQIRQFANQDVLLAVSTGVDSMVLLDLLVASVTDTQRIAVAHVNHGLRPESEKEARFINAYCKEHQLDFFQANWTPTSSNVEANARQFRYDFFKKIMNEQGYKVLLTAHHRDDQLETMLMKAIRDGQLTALKGIVASQPFANGQLVRPLLPYDKQTLYDYAKRRELTYFEDETNQDSLYFRNRMRQQVVPLLKKEHPQVTEHFQQIAKQVEDNEALLEEVLWEQEKGMFKKTTTGWSLDLSLFQKRSPLVKKYLLEKAAQIVRSTGTVALSQKQINQTLTLLDEHNSQWLLNIAHGWVIRRAYQTLVLEKKPEQQERQVVTLMEGTQLYLSDHQWIGLFQSPVDESLLPLKVQTWSTMSVAFSDELALPLLVRKRQDGDRIALTPELTKRLSRWLIDQKIPQTQREDAWFVLDSTKKGLVFFPFLHSYLSIAKETDKIRYVLLYKWQK